MAVVAKTPHGSPRPPPRETKNQQNNDRQSMTKEAKGWKKRGANNDGKTAKKSHKRSSTEGYDDENKAAGATTPPDGNAETNEQEAEDTGHSKQGANEKSQGTSKGQNKCNANDNGKTVTKSQKRSSAEGDNDEDKAAGANGAPGDNKRLMAPNGCEASGTQGAGSKNDVDSATTPPDGDAETNEQGAEDTGHNEQGANEKSQGTSTSNNCSCGNESSLSLDQSMQTPVRNTSVSKNGYFQFGKTQNLTLQ